jgi:aminoglycoside/choline kinase family phosphotransferase
LSAASSDASFRRYFRLDYQGQTRIAMDAPPDSEDCGPFVDVSKRLSAAGVHVPRVLASDLRQGFLLLTDLGDRPYLHELSATNAERLYGDAIDRLITMQSKTEVAGLPHYDGRMLLHELELFRTWMLAKELQIELSPSQNQHLDVIFSGLVESALLQPQVFVHRDYHSRNLMVTAVDNPGVLDFQGAVVGPVSYDLVSLLRDCYIRWPPSQVQSWVLRYLELAGRTEPLRPVGAGEFMRWFDLMGLQRHLKACGIFARLWHRDGKKSYLKDIPRTLGYISEVSSDYPELEPLARIVRDQVAPAIQGRYA